MCVCVCVCAVSGQCSSEDVQAVGVHGHDVTGKKFFLKRSAFTEQPNIRNMQCLTVRVCIYLFYLVFLTGVTSKDRILFHNICILFLS